MNLYFDLDAGYFVTSPGSRERLSVMELKRGDTCSLAVRFVTAGTVTALATGATGAFGMKEVGDYDGDFVASAATWTKTGTGSSTVYTFDVNLATTPLNTLLGVGVAADVASVILNAEMEFIVDGIRTSSNTIACTVHNDVVRGTESGPPEITEGVPINWTAFVTGTLGDENGSVVFPDLPFYTTSNGKPRFSPTPTSDWELFWDGSSWILTNGETGIWTSTADVATPDLVPAGAWHTSTNPDAWKPGHIEADGTPVVTLDVTQGVIGAMKVTTGMLYVVSSVTDGIPTWEQVALSPLDPPT